MRITKQELVEFAESRELSVLGKGKLTSSKIMMLHRLVEKGLLPKPENPGGTLLSYWENGTEIKERLIWIDEEKRKGKNYGQILKMLNRDKHKQRVISSDALMDTIDYMIEINPSNLDLQYIKARIYYLSQQNNEALEVLHQLLNNPEITNTLLPMVYTLIIYINYLYNNKEQEKIYSEKFLKYAENSGDQELICKALIFWGAYLSDYDLEQSETELIRAETMTQDPSLLTRVYIRLFKVYALKQQSDKVDEVFEKAERIVKDNSQLYSNIVSHYAFALFKLENNNNYANSLQKMNEAKAIFESNNELFNASTIDMYMAEMKIRMGNYKESIKDLRRLLNFFTIKDNPISYKNCLQVLSLAYKQSGNDTLAEYYEKEAEKVSIEDVN